MAVGRRAEKKRTTFEYLLASLEDAGMAVSNKESLICPLCWSETHFERLELEHIIPRSLRGHRETLTCSECNRAAGKDLETNVVQMQRVTEAFTGAGPIRANLGAGENTVAAEFIHDPVNNKMDIRIIGPASSEKAVEATKQLLMGGKAELSVSFTMPRDRIVQIGMLKAGYLALFQKYGYSLILRPGLKRVREIIFDRALEAPDLAGVHGALRISSDEPKEQLIYMCVNFGGHLLASVGFRTRLQSTVWRFVWLPVDETSDEVYEKLAERARSGEPSGPMKAKYER